MRFSIVVPVKDEVDLIPRTLPSYYSVNPSEVVICMDKPPVKEALTLVKEIAHDYHTEDITKIVEVERSPEWNYHQAHVRRAGFRKAEYDRILTGDIDLVINRNVLKTLKLVGRNNIGIASCARFYYPNSFLDFYRLIGTGILKHYIHKLAELYRGRSIPRGAFTALYALWRPYWLDTESEEAVKKLPSLKKKLRRSRLDEIWTMADLCGEDVYLHKCMWKRHRVVYLTDIGGVVLRYPVERHPNMQYLRGLKSAIGGRTLLGVLARTFFRAEPYYLRGYLDGVKIKKRRRG